MHGACGRWTSGAGRGPGWGEKVKGIPGAVFDSPVCERPTDLAVGKNQALLSHGSLNVHAEQNARRYLHTDGG